MIATLYRHAYSQANAGEPTNDPASIQLVPLGARQAEWLASSIETPPDLFVDSPYIRTRQTLAPTRERFPHVPHEEWPVHEYTYLEPTRLKGTTNVDRQELAVDYWVRNDPTYRDGPGAETFAEFMDRCAWLIDAMNRHGAQRPGIFTHGLYIRGILWGLFTGSFEATPWTMKSYRAFCFLVSTPNTSAITLVRHDNRWHAGAPDVSHLPPNMITQ